jgi:hypothetical protein
MIPEDKLVRDLWDFESQALEAMAALHDMERQMYTTE